MNPRTPSQPANPPKSRPVHEFRLGAIKAAIWANQTEHGLRHSVTFRRLFKHGTQWATLENFGRDELLLLAKLADETHTWICHQDQRDHASPRNE